MSRTQRPQEEIQAALERSISNIGWIAQRFRQSIGQHVNGAHDVAIQFGIGFTSEADLVVVSGGVEATATITVAWKEGSA